MIGAVCLTAALAPTRTFAGPPASPISQLQYIQTIAQVVGESSQFTASSVAADYFQWAKSRGMKPAGGWSTNTPMSADVVAETLVQLMGLNPSKFNSDFFRNLDSQGIHVDRNGIVTTGFIAALLDHPETSSHIGKAAAATTSPVKPGNGVGFGIGWYVHNGLTPPAEPPGPPPGAPGQNKDNKGGNKK